MSLYGIRLYNDVLKFLNVFITLSEKHPSEHSFDILNWNHYVPALLSTHQNHCDWHYQGKCNFAFSCLDKPALHRQTFWQNWHLKEQFSLEGRFFIIPYLHNSLTPYFHHSQIYLLVEEIVLAWSHFCCSVRL